MSTSHLADVLERIARALHAQANRSPLKPVQWEALRYLARANRFSRTPTALAAYLGATKGTVSQTVQVLETHQMVDRMPNPADRRQVYLELTDNGHKMLDEDPLARLESATTKLAPEHAAIATGVLQTLLHDILLQRGGRPFGICRTCRYFSTSGEEKNLHNCALLNVDLSDDDSARICAEHESQTLGQAGAIL